MIAHLCRLAWNRRRTNLLLAGELVLSFLVLTPLIAGWVLFAAEELKPLGFEHEDVWSVMLMDMDMDFSPSGKEEYRRNIELVWRELQPLDGVEAVALASEEPILVSDSWNGINSVQISDEGLETLGLRLVSGRWFQPEDEALGWTPAVIDRELSRALFGDEDPLGKVMGDSPILEFDLQDEYDSPGPDRVRVVGVVENCFYYKEFNYDVPGFIFLRISNEWLADPVSNVYYFLVKSHPGMGPAFGETLRSRVQAVVPADQVIRFNVHSLAEIWEHSRLIRFYMLWRIARISGLMMLVVALGLTGMMWQNMRRRTREIGIRRAVGAPGGRIYGQFLGELAVLVTAAIALGCVPILQFGLFDMLFPMVLWSQLPAYVAACSLGATALALYLLVLLCGLYPSWLASRVRPAEALHHD